MIDSLAPQILHGHTLDVLKTLPDESIQCAVTSPPYWALRSYSTQPQVWDGDSKCEHSWGDSLGDPHPSNLHEGSLGSDVRGARDRDNISGGRFCSKCRAWLGELGQEPSPGLFVSHLVQVFREVRRALRRDGTFWLNIADSFSGYKGKHYSDTPGNFAAHTPTPVDTGGEIVAGSPRFSGLKPKDLALIPFRLAIALQADGWYVRGDIIWSKLHHCMPESTKDRPTRAHEFIFLLTKSERYFYDQDAFRQPYAESSISRIEQATFWNQEGGEKDYSGGVNANRSMRKTVENFARKVQFAPSSLSEIGEVYTGQSTKGHKEAGVQDASDVKRRTIAAMERNGGSNLRDVWELKPESYSDAHFATFPTDLPRRCILLGSRAGDTVLDPFCGSGTTLMVARELGRQSIGIDLNPNYVEMAEHRTKAKEADLTLEY